jgi:hypothetical protein
VCCEFKAEEYAYLIFTIHKILKISQILYSATTYTGMTEDFFTFKLSYGFVVRINIIVTECPNARRHDVRISYAEFWPNETINEKRGHRCLFTSLYEVSFTVPIFVKLTDI